MKIILLIGLILMLIALADARTQYVETATGAFIMPAELASKLGDYDVIFFGELHGEQDIHQAQATLSELLRDTSPGLALSFEMWERDTQEIVDSFLKGELEEDLFVEYSRAWDNYPDYRPMIMLAREHGMDVIAANIPREYAMRVAREGWAFVEYLPEEERPLIARRLSAPEDDYREEFISLMSRIGGHQMDPDDMENYYRSQCVKDDTMAESIAGWRLR